MRSWIIVLVLAAAIGCATAGSFDKQAERLTRTAIKQSEALHAAGNITDDQFKTANTALYHISVDGRDLTKLLKDGQARPVDVQKFADEVQKAVGDFSASMGDRVAAVIATLRDLKAKADKLVTNLQ